MSLHKLDSYSKEALTPEGLCNLIEFKYKQEIEDCCWNITEYLENNPQILELSDSVSELAHLLFSKLNDEIRHLFKKETVIIFPCIKHHYHGTQKMIPTACMDNVVYRNIQGTHKVILNLLQKLRQVLENYQTEPQWSQDWKSCLDEMFTLENKVFNWIHIEQNLLYPKINS